MKITNSYVVSLINIILHAFRATYNYFDNFCSLSIVNCPAGSYQINKRLIQANEDGSETVVIMPECVECPTGSYQYVQGQTYCTVCPDYHNTRYTSTRLPEDCVMLCPPGEYSIDGLVPCGKCPTGEYQSSHGQLQCVVCPDYHSTYNELR